MKNWKTTLFGVLATVGMFFSNSANPALADVGKIVSYASTTLLGLFAGDASTTTK